MTQSFAGHVDTILDTGSAGVPFSFCALVHAALARPLLSGGIISIHDHHGNIGDVRQSGGERALLAEWNLH